MNAGKSSAWINRPAGTIRRTAAAIVLAGANLSAPFATPVLAQQVPSPTGQLATQTDIFNKVYEGAVARLARGDYVSAVRTFDILVRLAPEMPELHYYLGLSTTLADFERREQSLPYLNRALAADRENAIYNLVRIISDPQLSVMRGDDLYFTPQGADMLSRITPRIAEAGSNSRNVRFLSPVLASVQPTGDQKLPTRLPGFRAMATPGGTIKMAQWTDSVSLGQLLALSLSSDRFAPFESRIIAQLEMGLASLTGGGSDVKTRGGTPVR